MCIRAKLRKWFKLRPGGVRDSGLKYLLSLRLRRLYRLGVYHVGHSCIYMHLAENQNNPIMFYH